MKYTTVLINDYNFMFHFVYNINQENNDFWHLMYIQDISYLFTALNNFTKLFFFDFINTSVFLCMVVLS